MSQDKKAEFMDLNLLDGTPDGCLQVARKTHRGMAFKMPFSRIKDFLKDLPESGTDTCRDKKCVYILLGISEDRRQVAYIGETDHCNERFFNKYCKSKNWESAIVDDEGKKDKLNWSVQSAIIFCINNLDLTSDHTYYAETILMKIAKAAGQYILANIATKQRPQISERDKALADTFVETILLITGALGYSVFQSQRADAPEQSTVQSDTDTSKYVPEFSFSRKSKETLVCSATGQPTDSGFVVFKDSLISAATQSSLQPPYVNSRAILIQQGIIKDNKFTQDYTFPSPSHAVSVIAGSTLNGQISWTFQQDNKTVTIRDWEKERNSQSTSTE